MVTGWGDVTFARLAAALLHGPRPLNRVHAGEQPPLDEWDRMRTGQPIDGGDSLLQALLFIPAPAFAGPHQLLSGRFEFLQIVGLTLDEHAWGQSAGYPALQQRLAQTGASPVIDPARASVC